MTELSVLANKQLCKIIMLNKTTAVDVKFYSDGFAFR